jgi:hypothetical protein
MSTEEYIAITIYQDSNTREFKKINYSDDVKIITEITEINDYDENNLLNINDADNEAINKFFQEKNIFNEKTKGGYKENKNEKKYGYSTKVRKSFKNIQRNIRNKTLKV